MAAEVAKITAAGYKVLVSGCWILNNISYGDDWEKVPSTSPWIMYGYMFIQYYACEPQEFNGTDAQKELVMGGGVTMWSKYVDSANLLSRMW